MHFLLLTVFLNLLAYGNFQQSRYTPILDGRIVGGEDASIESFPYQVSVRFGSYHICGGSILSSRVVLTGAHCIYTTYRQYYNVQYGLSEIGGYKNIISAERIVVHENFDSEIFDYDVALIFLKSKIPLGPNARPIKLASKEPTPGTQAVITGWGKTSENGPWSSTLQRLSIIMKNNSVCSNQYKDILPVTDRMLCAGVDGGGQDACQGDSGGPLVANGKQIGIISWGIGCARPEFFGVYSNIAYLRDWINKNVK